jgi:hypothetical protein
VYQTHCEELLQLWLLGMLGVLYAQQPLHPLGDLVLRRWASLDPHQLHLVGTLFHRPRQS